MFKKIHSTLVELILIWIDFIFRFNADHEGGVLLLRDYEYDTIDNVIS